MGRRLPLFPYQASTVATDVDHLYFYLVTVTVVFSLLIAFLIVYFAIRYRRRAADELPRVEHTGWTLEIVWSVIPLVLVMIMFGWGASVFFRLSRPPDNAVPMYVTGKQWMWKIQHTEGNREINELHVPLGRPVKMIMTSEDVIHSFFIPDFRVKWDVLPGRYTTVWFQPTRVGQYRLFCTEYCGTKHSGMIGWVHVMEPQDYQAWLSGGRAEGSLASTGQKLFEDLACANCHRTDGTGRCPPLQNVFGSAVRLASGETVKADEAYIRESILEPGARIVAGYQPIMPTFQGLVTEEGLLQLVEYIRSLAVPAPQPTGGPAAVKPSLSGTAPGQR